MDEPNLKNIGKYQLLDQIGSSAAGTTYRARDAFRNRELAVKVLRDVSPLSTELKDRLYTALTTCSELSHRHIRKVQDLGEVDGQVYLAGELLTGLDLGGSLDAQVPIAQKLSLIAQVCEALAFAHGKGIAHGNLKPGNIFVADGMDAAILDFGIGTYQACMLAAGVRVEGLLPNYLAPEQILGEPFDARSDLFSLALILYEALTGTYPFQVPAGLIPRELVHADPELLRKVDPQMPEELERLLVNALNKNPQQRLQTAEEFAASLYTIARRLRRDQASPAVQEPAAAPPAAPERERVSPLESIRSETKAEAEKLPEIQETALQPWTARSFSAQSQIPAREERAPEPAPAPTQAAPVQSPAVPTVQASVIDAPAAPAPAVPPPQAPPAPRVPAQLPSQGVPPAAAPLGARLDPRATPMPRRFQRTDSPRTARKMRFRILTAAAGAVIAVWLVGSFISRQSLHATQSKSRVESAVPKGSARDPESRPSAEPGTSDPEPQKPVEATKKAPSAEQILRLRVKPLWEAGKYAQAMKEVDLALADDPSSDEAHEWKKRIRAAQDAEAAIK